MKYIYLFVLAVGRWLFRVGCLLLAVVFVRCWFCCLLSLFCFFFVVVVVVLVFVVVLLSLFRVAAIYSWMQLQAYVFTCQGVRYAGGGRQTTSQENSRWEGRVRQVEYLGSEWQRCVSGLRWIDNFRQLQMFQNDQRSEESPTENPWFGSSYLQCSDIQHQVDSNAAFLVDGWGQGKRCAGKVGRRARLWRSRRPWPRSRNMREHSGKSGN